MCIFFEYVIQKQKKYREHVKYPLYRNYSNKTPSVALLENHKDKLYFDSTFTAQKFTANWTKYSAQAKKHNIDATLLDIHGNKIGLEYVNQKHQIPLDLTKLMHILLPNHKEFHHVDKWNKQLFEKLQKVNAEHHQYLSYGLAATIDHAVPIHTALYVCATKASDIKVTLYIYYIFSTYLLYIYTGITRIITYIY